tara:strand:+ start:1339 stop:1833 length:495 start_codon:yes stop_codon:yes gene_type:complete
MPFGGFEVRLDEIKRHFPFIDIMIREIKFRAWNESANRYSKPFTLKSDVLNFTDDDGLGVIKSLTSEVVEQYTGLKDKNGKYIYEGDIIKFHTGMKHRDSINTKICFNEGCFGFRSLKHNGKNIISGFIPFSAIRSSLENNNIWLDVEEVLEVIGNIHENTLTQ